MRRHDDLMDIRDVADRSARDEDLPQCSKGWGERCPKSKGTRCRCQCGGANHGTYERRQDENARIHDLYASGVL